MNPAPYTEDTLVQQTTARFLEQELGWESVYAYNNEDFGPDSLLGRESDREEDAGKVSVKLAKAHPESEFEKYRIVQNRLFESDFDRMMNQLEAGDET